LYLQTPGAASGFAAVRLMAFAQAIAALM